MPTSLNGSDNRRKFPIGGMKFIAVIGCLPILLYSLRFWDTGETFRILGVGLLVAGAALMSGLLLGFIFVIPREIDKKKTPFASQPEETQAEVANDMHDPTPLGSLENLREISDWLTKIIVGVGLVELHSIYNGLGKLSYDLAPGLIPSSVAGGAARAELLLVGQAEGLAILILYFTMGFWLGCVWTIFLFNLELKHKNDYKYLYIQRVLPLQKAEALISANQFSEAMDTIDEALRMDPRDGRTVMTKARILKRQALKEEPVDRRNLLKQAIDCADQAIELLPDLGEPVYNKACYQALLDPVGMRSDLLANLKQAFRLNPELKQNAKEDVDLSALKQDEEFIKLIDNS